MSNKQRIGLIAAAAAIAVLAFVIVSPGDEGDDDPSQSRQTETHTSPRAETQPGEEETPEARPAPPTVERIVIRGGEVRGGAKPIEVESGETVRIAVSSDAPDEIHVHGYDLTQTAAPGQPARFRFKATIEGDFEIESHTAEDAGKDPLVARLQVAPG